jgi:hypothetical protein
MKSDQSDYDSWPLQLTEKITALEAAMKSRDVVIDKLILENQKIQLKLDALETL